MSSDEKFDLIMDALESLNGTIEDLKVQIEELVEKVENLSLPGTNFDVDEL